MGAVDAQVELLSESEHTRVERLTQPDGRSVIRKQPLGSGRRERLTNEVAILRRLSGAANIVQLAAEQPDANSILLDDVHGTPLGRLETPVDSSRMAGLLLELARAVASMHQRGVVHCDIHPGNMLLGRDGRSLYLIDFALAMTFAELRLEFAHHTAVVGTLPYLAPEQTGRTGRSVDRRADLYAVGATMYELATGRPPFGTGDPLRLIRDHLARTPDEPATVNPTVAPALSEIIMHLLEKEPDNRYQTAEGLIRDVERVRDGAPLPRVGADDVPLRLTEPSRLVGRVDEIDQLRVAFEAAASGESRGVLISGETGVGKTVLIDELRPIVSASDGWFTCGKFDRYRRDQEHDGVGLAFRGLGRLLLAEPEDELAEIRQRLLAALGPNVGMSAAVVPEFATLLKARPDPGDPLTAQVRARRSAVDILRAVASRKRPVVFVVDDVQWAGATPLGFIDQLLSGDEEVEGLLTVAIYREGQVQESDPLAPLLARWRRHPDRPEQLRVNNLDEGGLAAMVAEMLHANGESVTDLAAAVFQQTHGNPYETVQLLNVLRRDGGLQPGGAGWSWDRLMLDRRLMHDNVAELTHLRVDAMPAATRQTLNAMACMGGDVQVHALEVATGLAAATVEQRLAPAIDDGLLLMVAARRDVRFHHDQMRDVVLASIPPQRLRALRLRMARRLAKRPELSGAAADQYLSVIDAVHDLHERRHVAELLRQAAQERMWTGESHDAERMLAAAVRLTDETATLIELHTAHHSTLFRLGRLTEADRVYQTVISLSTSPYDRVEATRVQLSSLTNRNRAQEAIQLGLDLLGQLGWQVPDRDDIDADIDRGLDWCYRWIGETSHEDDLRRPDVDDRTVLAAGALISWMMPACFFFDQVTMAWLALAGARIWAESGPARTLVGAVGHLPWVLVRRQQAYRAGYQLMRRILTVGEERHYEPDLAQARFLYVLGLCHWFNPLEEEISEATRAREDLIRGGDVLNACYSTSMAYLDVAGTVHDFAAAADSAVAFAERTGNEQAAGFFKAYRWLAAALRGDPSADANGEFAIPDPLDPVMAANAHVARALAGALFDDADALAEQSEAAMSLLPALDVTYGDWQAHLVHAIALAHRVRTTHRPVDLAELDATIQWVAQRAADMPTNFRHLLSLIEAERAWAVGDIRTAIHAFDSALRDAGHRPWHRAFIAERLAKFMLAQGADGIGWSLLLEAREAYRVWGARAKVEQLDRAYASLDLPSESSADLVSRRSSIAAGAIDMIAILDASRALSSGTSIPALRAKVVEVLSALTGATDVSLLVADSESGRWLATMDGHEGLTPLDHSHRAPSSVIRYVERTREPLIVGNATRDDRFARDPYFLDVQMCSLLAVPVLSREALRAILLVENRLLRDAFPAQRLEAVMLIAGQLAVSLDNALIYSSLERKVAERTDELARANQRLEQLSIIDPLTGIANRRRLEESLHDEWQRARRTHTLLSLAMLDIDHFKQYNDIHGHRAGDRCLERVATQIDRCLRDTDLVARYGGEEFAIVMPDTGSADASEVAKRIRVAVADLAEPLTADRAVTVSLGVATLHDSGRQSTDELIERADAALYQAKRSGRNRVCSSADVDQPPPGQLG
jgi:diguanylate cyclase (GGDEF)-like protein